MEAACQLVFSLLKTTLKENRAPYNKFSVHILNVLQQEGLIRGFKVEEGKVKVLLKFYQGAPVIRNIRIISKPQRDIWVTPYELKYRTAQNTVVMMSPGVWVVSTTFGVVSHRRCIQMGLGGKVLFAVNNGYQHWC